MDVGEVEPVTGSTSTISSVQVTSCHKIIRYSLVLVESMLESFSRVGN